MYLDSVVRFLDNNSVGAAIGAFLAFFLVAATDWRRHRAKKKLIPIRLRIIRDIAVRKIETAKNNVAMIHEGRFTDAPVMKFPVADLQGLQKECLDLLSADEINALDALIYWLEAIDGVFDEARSIAVSLKKLALINAPTGERAPIGEQLVDTFGDAEKNLGMLLELLDFYLAGNSRGILEFQYARDAVAKR